MLFVALSVRSWQEQQSDIWTLLFFAGTLFCMKYERNAEYMRPALENLTE